jgi:hypothetical protein
MSIDENFFQDYPADVWIETGTYIGDAVYAACQSNYSKIFSIELNENLYASSKARFSKNSLVEIRLGSSAEELPKILEGIKNNESVVFWLDAHYSAGVTSGSNDDHPLLKEIDAIRKWKLSIGLKSKIIILIDDMRTFSVSTTGFSQDDVVKELLKIKPDAIMKRLNGYQAHTKTVFKEDILMISI